MNQSNNNLMRSKAGFTLIEMLVVIGIISILSAVAIPNMISWRNNAQFNTSVRTVKSAIDDVRMSAIKSNMKCGVEFTVGGHTFKKLMKWDSTANAGAGDYLIKDNYELPTAITISATTFGAGDRLEFNSRGMATNNGRVTLQSNGKSADVVVNVVGTSSIQ